LPPTMLDTVGEGQASRAATRMVPAASTRSSPLVERTLQAVGRLRGLSPKHSVPLARVARSELVDRVKAHVARDVPASSIRAEGIVQKLLGFVPTTVDYEAITYELLGAQLAGYYEPGDGTMYLAGDLDEATGDETLSHELVHALQDQYWNLRARSAFVVGQDDANDAFSALAEGDATSAMEDLTLAREHAGTTATDVPDEIFAARMLEAVETAASTRVPRALRRSLVAPYIDGTLFVNALRRQGGWSSVNEAWNHPPATTEQILHPEKWRTHEAAIVVPTPPPPTPDSVLLEANTYGEESLRLAFEEWLEPATAITAASGWGGDRSALYVRAVSSYAFAWHLRFDDASPLPPGAFAARAFAALGTALPRLGHLAQRTSHSFCVERSHNGALEVSREGRELVLTVGGTFASSEPWKPAMTCGETRAWAEAVLSTPVENR